MQSAALTFKSVFPFYNPRMQLINNFKNKKKSPGKKNKFSVLEDEKLMELVRSIGENNWSVVSNSMKKMDFNRSPRQCRDRYFHYLDPKIQNDQAWSYQDDLLLINSVCKYGHKWKYLEKIFPGRTSIFLRNRYCFIERKSIVRKNQIQNVPYIMTNSYSFFDIYNQTTIKQNQMPDINNKLDIPKNELKIENSEENKKNDLNDETFKFDDLDFSDYPEDDLQC